MAEQVQSSIGRGELQELIEAVRQSYASAVKLLWYENKKAELSEIDGAFVYSFKNLVPALDSDTGYYQIEIPSTYIALPHEMGVVSVSYMKSQNRPFVRIANGALGLFANLKSFVMGGNQVYFVDQKYMVFPKMTGLQVGNILLKLAVAVDTVDPEEEMNIPPNIQDQIVQMVIQKFNPKPPGDQTLNNG